MKRLVLLVTITLCAAAPLACNATINDGAGRPDAGAGSAADAGDASLADADPVSDGAPSRDGGERLDANRPVAKGGTIVPLYTYPTDPTWTAIVDAKAAHPTVPIVAIVDPTTTGAGPAKDAEYGSGITRLKSGGITVIGYVATTYAKRDSGEVSTEIDHWAEWYPDVDGVFLDEMDNTPGHEPYYGAATAYAKSKGFTLTVGNPGAPLPASYDGTVDVATIFEQAGVPDVSSLEGYRARGREHFAIIPYGVSSLDAAYVTSAAGYVGYIYVTNDELPNPWDSLPPYFLELLTALE